MTNSVAQAIAWAASHPTHEGGTWNGWCAAATFHAGGFAQPFPTAIAAYNQMRHDKHIYSPTQVPVSKVPNGWLLFWDYGSFGHVGIQTPKGVLMASGYVTTKASPSSRALGYIDAARYQQVTGHKFLGSTPYWRGQHMTGISLSPSAPKPAPAPKPSADTWTLAKVSKTLQSWARRGGYDGPIDGKMGVNSWKGVQTLLEKSYGYDGVIDGKPGVKTYSALQRLAKKGGYTGPVDGKMGNNSWHGVYKALT